jgi:hypothetical protein
MVSSRQLPLGVRNQLSGHCEKPAGKGGGAAFRGLPFEGLHLGGGPISVAAVGALQKGWKTNGGQSGGPFPSRGVDM